MDVFENDDFFDEILQMIVNLHPFMMKRRRKNHMYVESDKYGRRNGSNKGVFSVIVGILDIDAFVYCMQTTTRTIRTHDPSNATND